MIFGPFFDLQDVPFPIVRLLRRLGTWEQHGGAENPTMRLIDDALEGGQNGATGSQFTHRPTDLDSWASSMPHGPRTFPTVCTVNSRVTSKRRTNKFHALATIAGLATSHCVDDVLAVDRKTNNFLGMACLACLSSLLWLGCTRSKESLSVTSSSDLSQTPCGPPTLSISQDRFAQLTSMVKDVLESGHLHLAMAGKMWGRLGFSCTQMFRRFGRAKLCPFSRRQHEHRRIWLNHQLTSALKWWLEILSCSPPRVVPTNLSKRRKIVSKSDGEGSEAGVGVALWGKRNSSCACRGPSRAGGSSEYYGIVRKTWVVLMTFLRSKRSFGLARETSWTCSVVLSGFIFLTMWQHCRTWSMGRHPSSKETS